MNDLKSIATICANKISQADVEQKPFKHLVVDNFLPRDFADECNKAFPDEKSDIWDRQDDEVEKKLRSKYECEFDFPDPLQDVVRILNSRMILEVMSDVLDIPKLIPDPYFTGGGLNMTLPGGMLDIHVDGNYHDATGLNRRVNAILFLNSTWDESWGGSFGVFSEGGRHLYDEIAPTMNRLVIFDTHDKSFHGTPEPIKCPDGINRKSLILYYYTVAPREHTKWNKPHSALWAKKGFTDKKGKVKREYS